MEVRVNLENEFLIYIINSPVTCSLTLAYISSWASLVAQMLKKSESESHSILPWTLSDPRDYAVHRILHTRILEWVPFSFSRWSSWPRDIAQVSSIAGRSFTSWATKEAPDSKESACNAGNLDSIPSLGKSPGEGIGYPFQYSCLENYDHKSLAGYSPWGCRESDTTN